MSLLNAHLVLGVMQYAGLLISTASSGLVKSGSKALNVQSVGLKALGPPCIGRMMTGTQKRTNIWTTDYTRSVAGKIEGMSRDGILVVLVRIDRTESGASTISPKAPNNVKRYGAFC